MKCCFLFRKNRKLNQAHVVTVTTTNRGKSNILIFNFYSLWSWMRVRSPLSLCSLCIGPFQILKYFTDIEDHLFERDPTKIHSNTSLFNVLQQYCGQGSWWRGSTSALKCCMVKGLGEKEQSNQWSWKHKLWFIVRERDTCVSNKHVTI